MRVCFSNSGIIYDRIHFDEEENGFVLSSNTSDSLLCYSPLQLKKDDASNYALFKLFNTRKDYSENDILKVFIDKRQVGWLIPFQSLVSIDHDYSSDESFQKTAYVAYHKLLEQLDTNIDVASLKMGLEELCFSKEDNHFSCVLVVSKDNFGDSCEETWINNYLVSLYKYGFSKNGEGNLSPFVEKCENHKLSLKKNSLYICENLNQVESLFESVSSDATPQKQFVRFLFYYQFVELLMGVLLEKKLNSFLLSLDTSKNVNSRALLESKAQVDSFLNEKKRISILLNNCSKIPDDERELVEKNCKNFLEKNDPGMVDKVTNFATGLYHVRCFIVHSLYSINEKIDMNLKDVNDSFLEVLESLLLSFDPFLYFDSSH